jgi:hypothetical protein
MSFCVANLIPKAEADRLIGQSPLRCRSLIKTDMYHRLCQLSQQATTLHEVLEISLRKHIEVIQMASADNITSGQDLPQVILEWALIASSGLGPDLEHLLFVSLYSGKSSLKW